MADMDSMAFEAKCRRQREQLTCALCGGTFTLGAVMVAKVRAAQPRRYECPECRQDVYTSKGWKAPRFLRRLWCRWTRHLVSWEPVVTTSDTWRTVEKHRGTCDACGDSFSFEFIRDYRGGGGECIKIGGG